MAKSRAAVRASEQPTFAQLKELYAQIESGQITKDRLQALLEVRSNQAEYRPYRTFDDIIWSREYTARDEAEFADKTKTAIEVLQLGLAGTSWHAWLTKRRLKHWIGGFQDVLAHIEHHGLRDYAISYIARIGDS